jgi:predicted enzyme related to lactoylglutathione lyase
MQQQRTEAAYAPCWTELSVPDPEAAKAFYGSVFGWDTEADSAPEDCGCAPDTDGYAVFRAGKAPVAAVRPRVDDALPTAWSVCLSVEDADRTAARAAELGGRALLPPTDVSDLGRYGVLADPDGAAFCIWQASESTGSEVLGDPDAPGWIELAARDPRQALMFYPSVFGWTSHLSDHYTAWSLGGTRFGGLVDLGRMPAPADAPPHWKPYFRVADVDATTAKAAGEGGGVVLAPADVPGGDLRVSVLKDPQGAQFGVFCSTAAEAG